MTTRALHAVLDYDNPRKPVLRCKHCASTEPMKFPMNALDMTRLVDLFLSVHSKCKAPVTPGPSGVAR